MSPRTPEKFNEIRETTKHKIMEVALELFANEGYYPTSISKIAKKAGISKGLMYNYFESKEDLLKQIAFEGINEVFESFDPNKDGILTKEEFIYFIKSSVMMVKSQMNFWKLYFSLMAQPQVLMVLGDDFMSSFDSYFKTLADYFNNQGFKDGYTEVRFFVAMLDGVVLHYILDPENFPYEQVVDRIINIYA
ncbi:MAG: TetR/AcrR family transcriptional regulator [Bacteroidales bacterium]|nr:TetR/AcrR family transcriptional regulator [Bacteroidales bacterium]